ncbi:hypothetical protein PAXRUDRAFT_824767 [Paxillus rubicundulus Ve08.2h10]|uniref:Uncharacterized protein n=1 Tax=Paxillus rubicundulus Ve08.2h10 TaxID=930991 RepID=A0A0D0DHD6_9AGAM|nr:hypothetical protein PAXRUDRAFT_824767 [Paxillus rubicundulus Ve08.2h10]
MGPQMKEGRSLYPAELHCSKPTFALVINPSSSRFQAGLVRNVPAFKCQQKQCRPSVPFGWSETAIRHGNSALPRLEARSADFPGQVRYFGPLTTTRPDSPPSIFIDL